MAVTKIKPIRGTVNKAIAYILDPQKTDDAFYVSSYGCAASDAAAKEFEWTRNLAVQQGTQMPKVLARHLIQSFDICSTIELLPQTGFLCASSDDGRCYPRSPIQSAGQTYPGDL